MLDVELEDQLIEKVGGKLVLTSLMQKRLVELKRGSRPLVEVDNPKDLQGWLRLGRAYTVLGRRQDALKAYALAKRHFPEETSRIDRLIKELSARK